MLRRCSGPDSRWGKPLDDDGGGRGAGFRRAAESGNRRRGSRRSRRRRDIRGITGTRVRRRTGVDGPLGDPRRLNAGGVSLHGGRFRTVGLPTRVRTDGAGMGVDYRQPL